MPQLRTHRSSRLSLIDGLESRLLFAATEANAYEQFMLELINRGRANPSAEAARLGVSLNEGVTGTQISTAAKQPLAMNPFLTGAARDHVNWLRVNSKFQHEGSGNSSPTQRMTASGYDFGTSWGSAENLGLTLGSTLGDMAERTQTLYRNLFVDAGVAGRGHRTNLLNGAMEEMGSGVASGDYTYNAQQWTAIIAGQDFAYRAGNPYLTGVVYDDHLNPNKFYSPGEGAGGVTITATNSSGTQYTTTSATAGGYSLQVPAGTYTVTATKADGTSVARYTGVSVGANNVKRDFENSQFSVGSTPPSAPASVSNGTLTINGTDADDAISVQPDGVNYKVLINDSTFNFAANTVQRVVINGGNGDDLLRAGEDIVGSTINGGAGNDTIFGTANNDRIDAGNGNDQVSAGGGNDAVDAGLGNDTVLGEGGKDLIHGDDGEDRLNGGGGNDYVYGDGDNDRVYGGNGNDYVDGGGNVDRVYGDDGDDSIIGGSSNDRLYGNDGNDQIWGGKGKDYFDGGAGTNKVRDREDIESVLNAS